MDSAEKWLRENDPLFAKRGKLEHPYLTDERLRKINRREIPVSSVYGDEVRQLLDLSGATPYPDKPWAGNNR